MSRTVNALATTLLATVSSLAVAFAGTLPQDQTTSAVLAAASETGAQSMPHVAPVAFWLGLEDQNTDATQTPDTHGPAAPVVKALARPGSVSAAPLPAAPSPSVSKPAAPQVAAPLPQPAALHVPPLPAAAAAIHVPPLPPRAGAVHVPPLAPPRKLKAADVPHDTSEPALRPVPVTYVVPGPVQPRASADPAPAPAQPAPPAEASRQPAPMKTAPASPVQPPAAKPVAAAPPLPPVPAPASRSSSATVKAAPAPLPVQKVPVLKVADQTSTTAAPIDTKAGVDTKPMKHLKVGVGGGVLVHLPGPAATVFAADPTIARVEAASPTSIFVIGMKKGSTNLIATNPAGQALVQYIVEVGGSVLSNAASAQKKGHGKAVVRTYHGPYIPTYTNSYTRRMKTAINQIVPGANLVKVQRVGSTYILTGVVATPEIAQEAEAIGRAYSGGDDIIDKLQVLSSIQVNVRVRVAEVSRSMMHQLGLNWSVLGNTGHFQIGMFSPGAGPTGGTITSSAASTITSLSQGLSPLVTATGAGSLYQLGAGYTSGHWNLNTVLNALATNSLATILAEPNLTVESGHKADFLSGGQYPIPAPSTASNTVAVEYKNYGVSLSVTPTVIAPDKISLKVVPTVSQLDYSNAVRIAGTFVPALTMQKASTTVQLGSGQALAIAGLLQSTTSQVANGLPGAEGIPVLGALFRNNDYTRKSDELVIIVTPYLVNPVSNPDKLHAPTDGFVPATDLQQILFGKQMQGNDKPPSSTAPLDAGFLME